MLNQVICVGRLVRDIELNEDENGKKNATITLAVSRPFKNEQGMYDTDFIDAIINNVVASQTAEYCKKGDVIGVRGRLQSKMEDNKRIMYIVADKVTFLSSKKPETDDDLSA